MLLNRLGIACPDRPPSFANARKKESLGAIVLWYSFLISLAAQSRVYDLKGARLTLKTVHQRAEKYNIDLKDRK